MLYIPRLQHNTVNILGFNFIDQTFDRFMKTLEDRINNRTNTFVVTANPEIVMYARQHPNYRKIISKADFMTPDGIGIVKGAKILGMPIPERISGYDIFVALLKWGNQHHKSIYLLGAKKLVIHDLITVIHDRFPEIKIIGAHNGYFKHSKKLAKEIKDQQPDMVFLALGYPKQEAFINKYRTVNNGLWIGIGGSFDVLSGHVKRAPRFFIRHHLEWFYRLITNPQRLGRMMSLPKFLKQVYKQKNLKEQ